MTTKAEVFKKLEDLKKKYPTPKSRQSKKYKKKLQKLMEQLDKAQLKPLHTGFQTQKVW